MLSSLEGYAITSIKIDGVDHEFSTIKGIVEDVTEIILNLKQVRFKRIVDDVDHEKIHVSFSGSNTLKAGDINKFLNGFKVLNTDLIICHLEPNVKFQMELNINKRRSLCIYFRKYGPVFNFPDFIFPFQFVKSSH